MEAKGTDGGAGRALARRDGMWQTRGAANALPGRRRRRPAEPGSSPIPCPAGKSHSRLGVLAARAARSATRLCARPVEDSDGGCGNRSTSHGDSARTRRWWTSQAGSNKVSAMLGGGDDGDVVSSWDAAATFASSPGATSVKKHCTVRLDISYSVAANKHALSLW
jgi:hypothetical protein